VRLSTTLGLSYGWTVPFKVLGIAVVVAAVLTFLILPVDVLDKKSGSQSLQKIWSHAGDILKSRSIWGIAIGLMGLGAAGVAGPAYLLQFFSQVHRSWGITLASEIIATAIGFTLPGSLLGGWLGDKHLDNRIFLTVFAFFIGLVYLTISFISWQTIWGLFLIGATVYGALITIMYLIPSYLPESQGEGLTLSIGIINTTQFGFASLFLISFGLLSASSGYTIAWILTGIVTIILLPFIFLVRRNPKRETTRQVVPP